MCREPLPRSLRLCLRLEEVCLRAFALQFFTCTADRLQLSVVHRKKRTIDITANLTFAGADETVEGILENVCGHVIVPLGK